MSNIKQIAVFPVDYSNVAFLRFAHMGDFNPIAMLAPDLSVLTGEDISKLDGGSVADILLYSDYAIKIAEADSVYLIDSTWMTDNEAYTEIYILANELGKEVIASRNVSRKLNLHPKIVSGEVREQPLDRQLQSIEAPIISVFTIGDYTCQPQTEYLARKYFLERGYKVMQICSHEHGSLFGCLMLPDFLYDKTIDVLDKVLMFNDFIHRHTKKENPDLIILGVPEPILKYNNQVINGLGILPFIVQNAVQSDIGIVCLHFENEYAHKYLDLMANMCNYRFGVSAEFFGVSNCIASLNKHTFNELEYLHITSDFVDTTLKRDSKQTIFTVFAAHDEDDSYRAFSKMEHVLQENPAII